MRFNVNDEVRIRLTDVGRAALKADHEKLFQGRIPYKPPNEDEDGWSKWQLWSLMEQLGPHIRMGGPVPFETEIEILTKKASD